MQFEVPQFIDVEDKIFGPFTFKQFLYLAGGAALAYVSYKLTPFPFSILLALVFVGFGLLLAFYKINGRPFIEVAQSYISYRLKGRLYIWKRTPPIKASAKIPVPVKPSDKPLDKKFDPKTIRDLSQNLDILDNYRQ